MRPKTLGLIVLLLTMAAVLGYFSRRAETPAPQPTPASAPAAAAQPPAETAAAPAPPGNESASLSSEQMAHLVRPHSPVFGPANAPVTIVEVLDPACAACRAFAPVVEQLLFTYPEDVRVVVRYADFHPASLQGLRLLVAAQAQGKVHELLAALFERQDEWAGQSGPDPARAWKIAGEVGLDVPRAQKDALAASVDHVLQAEADDLVALKVDSTPTFFVNGKPLPTFGAQELADLVASEVQASKRRK
jgi:protein-disulfide isomerase